jgi:alanyl-tRNA synthetase
MESGTLLRGSGPETGDVAHVLCADAPALERLPENGPALVELPGDVELLRSVAARLTAAGRDALLCASIESGTSVVLMRAQGSTLDCAKLWKQLAAAHGGRGGGRPERAEGELTSRIADWPATVATLL